MKVPKGYVIFPHLIRDHIDRIAPGGAQYDLVMWMIVEEYSEDRPTPWVRIDPVALAKKLRPHTPEQLQLAVDDALKRGLIVRKERDGEWCYSLMPEDWPSAPDYEPAERAKSAERAE